MKRLSTLWLAALCLATCLPSWGAVQLDQTVAYLPGAQAPNDGPCTWEADVLGAVATRSNGAIAPASSGAVDDTVKLTVEVLRLHLLREEKKSRYTIVLRATLFRDGKLVATRDFQDDMSFKNEKPTCETLRKLGASLGKDVSDWVVKTPLTFCNTDCPGIHPDEPIVIASHVLLSGPTALNESINQECNWQAGMVERLAKAFNEDYEPTPRAKLEPRPIVIEKYPGRRLVLRADNIHALGGGGWTGPKWMTMSGELYDGQVLVGSFKSHTNSGRGFTNCRSINALSDHTVEMIVNWLISPTLNATLR